MPAKKPKTKTKTKTKPAFDTKLCRVFGVGAQGPLAGAFPDRVVFSFDETGEVSGFTACGEKAPKALGTWISASAVARAKKTILEEYGRRWKKLVVES